MTSLPILDMPEEHEEVVSWLERHLVGLQLGQLAGELQVVHQADPHAYTLEKILGEEFASVLELGLSQASWEQIRLLLTHPATLLELQEQVFLKGGDYWLQIPITEEHQAVVDRGKVKLMQQLAESASSSTSPSDGEKKKDWWKPMLSLVAICLLIGLGVWMFRPAPKAGWGWNHPEAMQASLSAEEYLKQLAKSASAWKNKRPETREALAKRIGEFEAGCERLIKAPHKPLAEQDRLWLVERCEAWLKKIQQASTDLKNGEDVLKVRTRMDEIVEKLMKTLNDRASTV